VVEYVGTLMDVTERRRAEEERQALAHANRIATMGQLTASTEVTPMLIRSSAVSRGNTCASTSFARNADSIARARDRGAMPHKRKTVPVNEPNAERLRSHSATRAKCATDAVGRLVTHLFEEK
jgi:hypothetical protein